MEMELRGELGRKGGRRLNLSTDEEFHSFFFLGEEQGTVEGLTVILCFHELRVPPIEANRRQICLGWRSPSDTGISLRSKG